MIDTRSTTWRLIAEWAAMEAAERIVRLKSDLDPIQTATARGELRVLDALLSLPDRKPDQIEPEIGGISPPEV